MPKDNGKSASADETMMALCTILYLHQNTMIKSGFFNNTKVALLEVTLETLYHFKIPLHYWRMCVYDSNFVRWLPMVYTSRMFAYLYQMF